MPEQRSRRPVTEYNRHGHRVEPGPDPERANDEGTYVNTEPEDLEDKGYESLEADAGDDDEIRAEADEFATVSANEPLDEDVEDAIPTEILIPTGTGDTIEEEIEIPPENELQPPSNADQPLQRAPDERQPETAGHALGDIDIEGDWPEEGYYDQDETPQREP